MPVSLEHPRRVADAARARRDAARALRRASGTRAWRVLVPIVCLVAGLIFAVTATDSRGTDLRAPDNTNLADLVRTAEQRVQSLDDAAVGLQGQLSRTEARLGQQNGPVAAAQRAVTPLRQPAGLTAVTGAGIEVVLDDAADPAALPGVDPNQLVVHQSDLQAVVNALWAGGAQAMSISGERIIPTSAVRCVGPTLLLNGQVYSPPFRVAAIGPYQTMQEALGRSRGVHYFREAAEYYGLGYTVVQQATLNLPAYRAPVSLTYAKPLHR